MARQQTPGLYWQRQFANPIVTNKCGKFAKVVKIVSVRVNYDKS